MRYSLFLLVFCVGLCYSAIAQTGGGHYFQASLELGTKFEGSTTYSESQLDKYLLQALNRQTTISISENTDFLAIRPMVSIINKDITNSAPPITAISLDLNLSLINTRDHTIFYTEVIPLKGAGRTTNKAIVKGFQQLRFAERSIKSFIEGSKLKLAEYYETQCDRIMSEVSFHRNMNDYESAMLRLMTVPSIATNCYEDASLLLLETYRLSQNEECKKLLNVAESAVALRRYEAAVHALVQIDPEANCYGQAAALKKRIQDQTEEQYDNLWKYSDKRLEIFGQALKAKYEAVSELVTAEVLNPSVSSSTRNSGGTVNIVNNVNGQNSTSQPNEIRDSGGQENKSPVNFRIVTPAIRSGAGEIHIYQEDVSIYGFVDQPQRVKALLIDDLQTSWDNNGVFTRTLKLKEGSQKIAVDLVDDQGISSQQVLKLIRKESKIKDEDNTDLVSNKNQTKVALVIGNDNYQHTGPLRNAKNDAKDMQEALVSLGFQVQAIFDANYNQMRETILKFSKTMEGADVSLFYYSGHGIELNRENYLIPVDAIIESAEDIKLRSLEVNTILKAMEVTNDDKLNIVILDACRNNPFPTGNRGGAGLSKMTPASGMLIAYATEPGAVASDGSGVNGLYTGELVKQIKIPQRIEDVFMNTRIEVERKSEGNQRPWEEARLKGVFYLKSDD